MTGRILTFYLCGSLCGIDIRMAKEINRNVTYTVVPGASDYIVGLLNLRGQIITLFDLVQLLHFKQQDRKNNKCVILKSEPENPEQIGFFVDELGDVIDVTSAMCESTPANIVDIENRFIYEVVKLENEVLLILDLSKIFKLESF